MQHLVTVLPSVPTRIVSSMTDADANSLFANVQAIM